MHFLPFNELLLTLALGAGLGFFGGLLALRLLIRNHRRAEVGEQPLQVSALPLVGMLGGGTMGLLGIGGGWRFIYRLGWCCAGPSPAGKAHARGVCLANVGDGVLVINRAVVDTSAMSR